MRVGIDASKALEMPGVVAFIGADDIPGDIHVRLILTTQKCNSKIIIKGSMDGTELLFPKIYSTPKANATDEEKDKAAKDSTLLYIGEPVYVYLYYNVIFNMVKVSHLALWSQNLSVKQKKQPNMLLLPIIG